MKDFDIEDFEEEVIGRIYGLGRRVTRLEQQMEILFAAVIDGNETKRNSLFAAVDLAAETHSHKLNDEMEKKLFASNLRWVKEASQESTANLIGRLLIELETRLAVYR